MKIRTILSLSLLIVFCGGVSARPGNVFKPKGAKKPPAQERPIPKPKAAKKPPAASNDLTVTLPGKVKLEMKKILAGSFLMGSPEWEDGRVPWETQHRVTLTRDYWLGTYEVTQAQWKAVMGNNPSHFQGDDLPVESVSWSDAKEFCERLNKNSSIKRPKGYRFDLPTEAQWEYACRAGTTGAYHGNLDDVAWYDENSGDQTHPVGRQQPNAWGLYDMHGNVWEWCRDWYGEGSYAGDATDPTGVLSGSDRVLRGGGWLNYAQRCRSAFRFDFSPGYRFYYLGFRLALVPVQ
ncbi:MAG: formylglycine-generating enzyme family protein [Victivallales bacterium]|nr:formylglycine-generating enzyme family protein [Victivallales bacterium]